MNYDPTSNQLLAVAKHSRAIDIACYVGFVLAAPLIWYLAVAIPAGFTTKVSD